MSDEQIRKSVREFLLENIYGGNDNGELKDDTPLISTRIMDSIVALKMVSFLEAKFNIEFEAHEVDQENLDTIDKISAFIKNKMK
ncbi:N/A [soil metagenome]